MGDSGQLRSVLTLSLAASLSMQSEIGLAGQGLEIAGPEIWVSGPEEDEITGSDDFADIAVDEMGRRIYVWTIFGVNGGIALRRFDDAGQPLEDPRIINTTDSLNKDRPRVAVASDGSFLVIWQSREDIGGGGSDKWVRIRAFNSAGDPLGNDQRLTNDSVGTTALIGYDVAALRTSDGSHGGYIVVFESLTNQTDASGSSIQARFVSAAGQPTGNPIELNAITSGSQRKPTVTEMADGGFFAAWIEPKLQGRRFTSAGVPVGDQIEIVDRFSSALDVPDAAIGWGGTLAVAWEDSESFQSQTEVRMRLFDSEASPLGPDFRVNTELDNFQNFPRIGDFGPRGFLVTWESLEAGTGADLDGYSIQARIVTGTNTFHGPQTQYNIWGTDDQEQSVSHGWYGRVGSAWSSIGNDQDPPAFQDHIMGRNIEYCIFCDDFEWFDPGSEDSLWRWTSVVGAQ